MSECGCPWVERAPGAYYLYDVGGLVQAHRAACPNAPQASVTS